MPEVLREKLSFSTLKANIWPKILESVKKAKLIHDMYLIMANMTVLLPKPEAFIHIWLSKPDNPAYYRIRVNYLIFNIIIDRQLELFQPSLISISK